MRRADVKGIGIMKMSQSKALRLPGSQMEHCKWRTRNKQCSVISDVTERELDQEGQATCVENEHQHGSMLL